MTRQKRDALIGYLQSIAEWSPELQARVMKENTALNMWRGCIYEAQKALEILRKEANE